MFSERAQVMTAQISSKEVPTPGVLQSDAMQGLADNTPTLISRCGTDFVFGGSATGGFCF